MPAKRDLFTILTVVAISFLVIGGVWQYFAYLDFREKVATKTRMDLRRKEAEESRVKDRARFPEHRAHLVKEMRDAIDSGAKIGVAVKAAEFERVADEEYLTLLRQVRAMDASVDTSIARDIEARTARQDERANLAITYARLIRKQAHDPDSVEFLSVLMSYESKAICYRYRARNGFNALRQAAFMITSRGELMDESSKGFSAAWNRDCVNKNGQEARAAANIYK